MKKRVKQNIIFAVIGVSIIVVIVGYNYSVDQAKIKGFAFGNELQQIQEDVKKSQTDFDLQIGLWKENLITKEEILEYSETHILKFEEILPRYDLLSPPVPFIASVELFKLSTMTQIESDKELILWIETEDESYITRSNSLLQDSFDYELAALAKFNEAKKSENP